MTIQPAQFDGQDIRRVYDEASETWWFSVVDVVQVLTQHADYQGARNYWKVLKNRLLKEGSQSVTSCNRLKLPAADGKNYLTDVATAETLLRLVQSIPSSKAELSTRQVAETQRAKGLQENKGAAVVGGRIAKQARQHLELQTGRSVATGANYLAPVVKKSETKIPAKSKQIQTRKRPAK